jgi:hypothetical protein
MASRERMQHARRHDPYPWTWEPFALWALMLLMILALAVQVGRGAANWFAGAGFTWPASENVVTSVPTVIGGDPTAGLAHPARPDAHLLQVRPHWASATALHGWLIGTEIATLVGYGIASFHLLRVWGPWRMLGMASRAEAEQLLGRTRLRKVASVVRPDIYGNTGGTGEAGAGSALAGRDADPTCGALGSGPLMPALPARTSKEIPADESAAAPDAKQATLRKVGEWW